MLSKKLNKVVVAIIVIIIYYLGVFSANILLVTWGYIDNRIVFVVLNGIRIYYLRTHKYIVVVVVVVIVIVVVGIINSIIIAVVFIIIIIII